MRRQRENWTSVRLPRALVERLRAYGRRRYAAAMRRSGDTDGFGPAGMVLHELLAELLDADDAHRQRAVAQRERRRKGHGSPPAAAQVEGQ